jgi:ankyrin repeat protein
LKRFFLIACCLITSSLLVAQTRPGSLASLVQRGDRKAALESIRAGADVNEAQPDGTRPIHWAVFKLDYELLDALIAKKANADVTNEFGATPLAEAVKVNDVRMVKTLLDAGAGVESANLDGETALMLAIKSGELPIVQMLVNAGANVNTIEKQHLQTPLMYAAAAEKNAGEMVKLLLSKGADVKPRSLAYDWPSHIAEEPRVQYHPFGGLTALLYAARDGCYDCVEALIAKGADVNVPTTTEAVTPLMIALDNDNNDIAKLLLDRGANPGVWDWYGRTALYIAIDRKNGGSSGGGLRVPIDTSHSARFSNKDIIRILLDANVDPNAELRMHRPTRGGYTGRFSEPLMDTGATPLLRAVMGNDMETIQALLAKGASPNINGMGVTPFLLAAGVGGGGQRGGGGARGGGDGFALLDLLLEHGADVNAQVTGTKTYSMRIARSPSTNEGMTALHAAVQAGRLDLVRYLLEKGANPEIVDGNGRKAIDLVGGARGGNAAPAGAPAAGAGRGRGGPQPAAASAAEIRTLLENAASRR